MDYKIRTLTSILKIIDFCCDVIVISNSEHREEEIFEN